MTQKQDAKSVTFTSSWPQKLAGSVLAVFGFLFGLSGLASGSVGLGLFMALVGLGFAVPGIRFVQARVVVERDQLATRWMRTRVLSAEEITDVAVGSGGGSNSGITAVVTRASGRPVRLIALTCSDFGRAKLEAKIATIRGVFEGEEPRERSAGSSRSRDTDREEGLPS